MDSAVLPQIMQFVDSHTAGEPTRCIIGGLPDLGKGSMAERLERLRKDHDHLRRAILCEPRGSDVLVGAYVLEPVDPASAAGVVFFNDVGYLGMCGHGTIGLVITLKHLGKIDGGARFIETPVGIVSVECSGENQVSIHNVPAYRYRAKVAVDVSGHGRISGDVAWGGNWFFLASLADIPLTIERVGQLSDLAWRTRRALVAAGIAGADGAEIDHIEFYSAAHDQANDSRNFVLCPGGAYDRSPCGTGTSAKLACLAADGHLKPGQLWRQEGILGSVFEGVYQLDRSSPDKHSSPDPTILPTITGSAHVTMEGTLRFDSHDPFRLGVPA